MTHQTREKAKWARPHLGQDWGCCHIFENWAFILPSFRLRIHSSNRSQSRPSPHPLLIACLFAFCTMAIRSVMISKFRVHQLPGKTSLNPINYFMRSTHFLRPAQGQIWGLEWRYTWDTLLNVLQLLSLRYSHQVVLMLGGLIIYLSCLFASLSFKSHSARDPLWVWQSNSMDEKSNWSKFCKWFST